MIKNHKGNLPEKLLIHRIKIPALGLVFFCIDDCVLLCYNNTKCPQVSKKFLDRRLA